LELMQVSHKEFWSRLGISASTVSV